MGKSMSSNVEEQRDVAFIAARELTERLAPEEIPFFDDFVKDLTNKHPKKSDPLAFGISDAALFLTPHILYAYEHAGTALLGLGCAVVTDVSKDILKARLKDWLSRWHAEPKSGVDSKLIPFRAAVEATEKTLSTAGLDETRRHELALAIVASLLLVSDEKLGVESGHQR
jgi:hypothetical protein